MVLKETQNGVYYGIESGGPLIVGQHNDCHFQRSLAYFLLGDAAGIVLALDEAYRPLISKKKRLEWSENYNLLWLKNYTQSYYSIFIEPLSWFNCKITKTFQ